MGYYSRRMPRVRSFALATSLVAALACHPRGAAVQPGGDKPAGGGTVGGGGDYAPLAPITRGAEILPASTLAMLDVAGPTRLAEIIGRDALVAKFQPEYQKLAADMTREIGHDVLDPKQLAAIGVDANGRMGAALLDVEPFTGAFWFSLTDAAKFRAMVFDLLSKQDAAPKSMPLGGAEVVTLRAGREWLVIRAPLAVFVVREGGEESDNEPALAIASADPNRALANDKEFRRTTGRLAAADALAYVDGKELWSMVEDEIAKKEGRAETNNWARDELANAKQRGEKPERIAELEAQAKEVDESNARWQRRQQAERDLVKKMFAGVGTGVWTFSAKPGGIVGEGRWELGAESLLLKILRNNEGAPALPRALDGRPLWMMTGAVDPNELVTFLDLAMQTEGTSWKELAGELKAKSGLDLDGELRPLFTGNTGFALTLDGKLEMSEDAAKNVGFGLDLELSDPGKAQAVLDKLGAAGLAEMKKKKPGKDEPKLRKDGKGWLLDIPKWRKVYTSIAGSHLVVSTDAGLAKRLASGGTGGGSKLAPPSAMAAAGWEKAAFGTMIDLELSMWMFMARSAGDFSSAMVESPEDAKVPKSKAYKAKQKQIDAVSAKLKKLRAKREAEEFTRFRAVTQPWGAIAGNLQEDGNALVATGGLFVRSKGGIAGALMDSLTAVKALGDEKSSVDVEMGKAFEERSRLEQEQREIRERDLAKHRGKSGAVVPAVPQ